jgi:hypothetical protein
MDDLVLGAPDARTYDETPRAAGVVYLFRGSDLTAGSWTTDDASASVTATSATMHGISLAMGDLSGDGKADILTAAPTWSGSEGQVYLFVSP